MEDTMTVEKTFDRVSALLLAIDVVKKKLSYDKVSLTVAGCIFPKHAIRDFAVYVAVEN